MPAHRDNGKAGRVPSSSTFPIMLSLYEKPEILQAVSVDFAAQYSTA
jgi:hypothetical protein